MEGMLFWLEADARIGHLTDGNKSLDDFVTRSSKQNVLQVNHPHTVAAKSSNTSRPLHDLIGMV